MSKYIIDVGEGYIRHGLERTLAIPVRINEHEDHWMDTRIPVTPYKEPSLDEAYAEGYEEGMQLSIDDAKLKELYKRGLADAWYAAKKLDHMSDEDIKNVFGCGFSTVFETIGASEAIEMLNVYEQERDAEIEIGDEVVGVFSDGKETRPFVFIRGSKQYYFGLYSDTGEFCQGGLKLRKTGRHFDEIASALEKMKG